MNPYRAVEGTLPRKRDVALWSHDRFMDFFRFVSFFMEEDMVKVNQKKRVAVEKMMTDDLNHPWAEFMWRINCFTSNKLATDRKFYYRLAATMRLVGGHVKANPALVSDDMKAMVEKNPRLNWVIPHFKTVTTKIGAEVVVPDTQETVGFVKGHTPPSNPEVSLMESMLKTANLFDMIVSSIKKSDINDMTVKEKVSALSRLSFIWTQSRNMKPNTTVFKQMNVYKASKDDLEKAISDFSDIESNGDNTNP